MTKNLLAAVALIASMAASQAVAQEFQFAAIGDTGYSEDGVILGSNCPQGTP